PVCARAKEKGNHLNTHDQSSGTTSLQRHSDSTKSSARDFRCSADQRPTELCLPAPAFACARAAKRSLYRAGAERARRNLRLGGANARRHAERFVLRAKREGLGASLQRGPHLYQEIVRAKRPLFLSARPSKIRERADRSHQSHAAFHASGRGERADGTGEWVSVSQRFSDFGRGAHGRANRLPPDRDGDFAISFTYDG